MVTIPPPAHGGIDLEELCATGSRRDGAVRSAVHGFPPKVTWSSRSTRSNQVFTSSRSLENLPTYSAKYWSVSTSPLGPRRVMKELQASISHAVRLCFAFAFTHSRISPSPLPAASWSFN